MKTFFEKLEYRFLVETTTIESNSFPFKTTVRNQYYDKLYGNHKMDLSLRVEFCQKLLYFFGIFFPVSEPLKKS